jgi:antitoxin (DNA-binding transcriptional repressor) of toxin-antitoxin stability system
MRPTMNIHALYPKHRQLLAWIRAGAIVDVESDGEIIARIEPAPQFPEKKSTKLRLTSRKRE